MSVEFFKPLLRFRKELERQVLIYNLKRFVTGGASEPDIAKIIRDIPTEEDIEAMKKRKKLKSGE